MDTKIIIGVIIGIVICVAIGSFVTASHADPFSGIVNIINIKGADGTQITSNTANNTSIIIQVSTPPQPTPEIIYITPPPQPTPEIIYITVTPNPTTILSPTDQLIGTWTINSGAIRYIFYSNGTVLHIGYRGTVGTPGNMQLVGPPSYDYGPWSYIGNDEFTMQSTSGDDYSYNAPSPRYYLKIMQGNLYINDIDGNFGPQFFTKVSNYYDPGVVVTVNPSLMWVQTPTPTAIPIPTTTPNPLVKDVYVNVVRYAVPNPTAANTLYPNVKVEVISGNDVNQLVDLYLTANGKSMQPIAKVTTRPMGSPLSETVIKEYGYNFSDIPSNTHVIVRGMFKDGTTQQLFDGII